MKQVTLILLQVNFIYVYDHEKYTHFIVGVKLCI
jgi:hypothetical protein